MSLKMSATCRGNLMRVKVDMNASGVDLRNKQGVIGGVRGKVKQFSKASRKRMLELFASLDSQELKTRGAAFLTLTYGQEWHDPDRAKQHLYALMKRIGRRQSMDAPAFVWKMEPQKRGAPHFHIVILGWKRTADGWPITKDDFAQMWAEVIGERYLDHSTGAGVAPFTRIEHIRSWKRLVHYVSKYG